MVVRRGLAAAVLSTLVVAGLAMSPAHSADDAPPVTMPDEVTVLPGGSKSVDVMANDSDDLDQQALCRARGNSDVQATVDSGKVFVNADTDQPGDYQVQYQACDFDYLSVGTVTVHAVAPKPLHVHKVAGSPGVVSATNPNPVRVVLLWAKPQGQHLDGHLSLRAGETSTFTVTRHHIVWIAFDPSSYWEDGSIVDYGHLRHIPLPPTRRSHRSPVSPALTSLWRKARTTTRHLVRGASTPSAAPWPSDPTTVLPPTPRTDTIHWWSGSWDRVPVTRNDTDPQGQHVDVCRLSPADIGPSVRKVLTPSVIDGQLDVGTAKRAEGTFELPYYVCNSGRLAPALLRLVLTRAQPLSVRRVPGHPGRVTVHNPNPQRVSVEIGRPNVDDVYAFVPEHGTRTFRVPRKDHHWNAMIGRHGGYAGSGRIAPASS